MLGNVERAWQWQRRPRHRRRARPPARAAGKAELHAAPRVAHPRGRTGLLLQLRQRRAVAVVPHRARATGVPHAGLGAIRAREPALRRHGQDRGAHRRPVVLVQDYHFALLPRMIRERLPDATIITFWHIPWPNPEAFAICPWRDELLPGLLGSSILGFHTQFHCNNFLDTVDRLLEARVDRETFTVTRGGQTTAIRRYPISIEWPPAALAHV